MSPTKGIARNAVTPSGRKSSPLLLIAGASLIFMTFMRYSLPEVGWVAFAPLLILLHDRGTIGSHFAVLGTLVIAFLATVSKMATAEIPWAPPVPMFAIPLALSYFVALAIGSLAHRRLGARWGTYTFAAMATALGWFQYTFTPGSSWGVLAHTQLDNLPLVQLAALTGVGGITCLVALGSGLVAAAWTVGVKAIRTDIAVFGILLGSALVYGQLRLGQPVPGALLRVGGVISPVTHDEFYTAYQNVDVLRLLDDELFARSGRAADLGAKVIVWPENATLVTETSEPTVTARAQAFAKAYGVLLFMAYGVFETAHPSPASLYVNKYRVYAPDGSMLDEYLKRHPVPGDPNPAGTAHARVVAVGDVALSGAICYDYGFPQIARDNARDGAQLAVVPSSDWRGIDPEHGRMALMNAVAVGLPMVRPVRAATSIASDQYGRLLASLRPDSSGDGVLVAAVPTRRVPTLYARTGELLPLVALAFCLLAVVRALRSRPLRATPPPA